MTTDSHILDRAVWNSLATMHERFATGSPRARRFEVDVNPLGAACDESEESLRELGALVEATGSLVVTQANPIVCPPGTRAGFMTLAAQMIHELADMPGRQGYEFRRLGEADAPAMVELAALTKPGPFANRTCLLGEYWGIERDGKLIAMAGERLKQPGFTEISGVCTHPDHLGRGYGRELCLLVLDRIRQRGEQPYLHVYMSNEPALALYRKLGFRERRQVHVAQIVRDREAPVA